MRPALIFHGFPWSNEIQLDSATVGPVFAGPRHELRAVVDGDRARYARVIEHTIECFTDGHAGQGGCHLQSRTLATPLIHDGEYPELTTIR